MNKARVFYLTWLLLAFHFASGLYAIRSSYYDVMWGWGGMPKSLYAMSREKKRLNLLRNERKNAKEEIEKVMSQLENAKEGLRKRMNSNISNEEKSLLEEKIREIEKRIKLVSSEKGKENLEQLFDDFDAAMTSLSICDKGYNQAINRLATLGEFDLSRILKELGNRVVDRSTRSFADNIGRATDQLTQRTFEYFLGKFVEGCSWIKNLLLHGGCKPFEEMEITMWKKLLIGDLKSIEKMLKSSERLASRSRDMGLREIFDLPGDDEVETETGKNEFFVEKESAAEANGISSTASFTKTQKIWQKFVDIFGEHVSLVVDEINSRRPYYSKDSSIYKQALILSQVLVSVALFLQKTKDLKDMVTLEEVKEVFPYHVRQIENMFSSLTEHIKYKVFSFKKSSLGNKDASSYFSSSDYDKYGDSFDSYDDGHYDYQYPYYGDY